MDKIKLLYVKNIISRTQQKVQQQLSFFMLIENIYHDKQVDVLWAGEDGILHTLSAKYHSMQGNDKEYWQAHIDLSLTEIQSLAGNIQFSLRYRVLNHEYWDNQQGHNYSSDADSGVKLTSNKRIQNIDFSNQLNEQQMIPISVVVGQSLNAQKVTIHWTTDDWKTTRETACQTDHQFWNNQSQSNARNPNQYGSQLWTGSINQGDSFKLQYILSCDTESGRIWDNNYGNNYAFQHSQLKILILNLHCYQEQNQDEKFTKIAKVIDELEVDIVCLQEVAEYWRDGEGDWESNSAKIINDRLAKPFHLHTDWSHLGFDKYREGVAILSRYPLSNLQAKYVSESHDIYNIHSRKVVVAQVQVPYIGAVNIFSAHLSWLEDGFQQQFKCLHEWAESCQNEAVKATLLCGDFNITAGSSGYELVVNSKHYDDQFLAANEKGVFEKIFRVNDAHWKDLLADDYRIDYIFMNKKSALQVSSAKVVFTDQDYGRVSDHCGYFMTFEPKI
ncbi:MAG: endonuclease/exonuclease/phosphatase family protein [Methylococcales bacterium]|nr:endonuclease/exonuclease/phosphatase family protein [Methylococcales bacterium]